MALDYKDPKTDEIGNLSRAALYLGKGQVEVGLDFLKKAIKDNPRFRLTIAERALDLAKKEIFKARGVL